MQKREEAMPMLRCHRNFPTGHFPWGYENNIIRLSIFLITGVCVGFPALLWSITVLYHHHKSGSRLSFIAIFLLLSDLLELILNPVLVAYIFKENYAACNLMILFFGARLCGHLLQQLVALESILIQKYPSLAVIFSPACSISLSIIVWLVALGCPFIQDPAIFEINLSVCVLPVIVCAVTCIVTCKARPDTNQPTDRKQGVLVLSVSMFNLIVLYVPLFSTYLLYLPFMLDCLTSMRLISEPLLCVLICRENHLDQITLFVAAQ